MERRTSAVYSINRTGKFLVTQGWAERVGAISDDLVLLANGIETITSGLNGARLDVQVEAVIMDVMGKKDWT